jgi:hypothetical protein
MNGEIRAITDWGDHKLMGIADFGGRLFFGLCRRRAKWYLQPKPALIRSRRENR